MVAFLLRLLLKLCTGFYLFSVLSLCHFSSHWSNQYFDKGINEINGKLTWKNQLTQHPIVRSQQQRQKMLCIKQVTKTKRYLVPIGLLERWTTTKYRFLLSGLQKIECIDNRRVVFIVVFQFCAIRLFYFFCIVTRWVFFFSADFHIMSG